MKKQLPESGDNKTLSDQDPTQFLDLDVDLNIANDNINTNHIRIDNENLAET